MKVLIKDGYVVTEDYDWRNVDDSYFLQLANRGDYDSGIHGVNLRQGKYKLPSTPHAIYTDLKWLIHCAEGNGINFDDTFESEWLRIKAIYTEAYEKSAKIVEAMLRRDAAKRWEKSWEKKTQVVSDACGFCPDCADVIDGDLYCRRYKRMLDIRVGEKVTPDGKVLMFASHGVKCDKCMEATMVALEREKEEYINEYVELFKWDFISEVTKNEMNKGEMVYV